MRVHSAPVHSTHCEEDDENDPFLYKKTHEKCVLYKKVKPSWHKKLCGDACSYLGGKRRKKKKKRNAYSATVKCLCSETQSDEKPEKRFKANKILCKCHDLEHDKSKKKYTFLCKCDSEKYKPIRKPDKKKKKDKKCKVRCKCHQIEVEKKEKCFQIQCKCHEGQIGEHVCKCDEEELKRKKAQKKREKKKHAKQVCKDVEEEELEQEKAYKKKKKKKHVKHVCECHEEGLEQENALKKKKKEKHVCECDKELSENSAAIKQSSGECEQGVGNEYIDYLMADYSQQIIEEEDICQYDEHGKEEKERKRKKKDKKFQFDEPIETLAAGTEFEDLYKWDLEETEDIATQTTADICHEKEKKTRYILKKCKKKHDVKDPCKADLLQIEEKEDFKLQPETVVDQYLCKCCEPNEKAEQMQKAMFKFKTEPKKLIKNKMLQELCQAYLKQIDERHKKLATGTHEIAIKIMKGICKCHQLISRKDKKSIKAVQEDTNIFKPKNILVEDKCLEELCKSYLQQTMNECKKYPCGAKCNDKLRSKYLCTHVQENENITNSCNKKAIAEDKFIKDLQKPCTQQTVNESEDSEVFTKTKLHRALSESDQQKSEKLKKILRALCRFITEDENFSQAITAFENRCIQELCKYFSQQTENERKYLGVQCEFRFNEVLSDCEEQKDDEGKRMAKSLCRCYQEKCNNEAKTEKLLCECDIYMRKRERQKIKGSDHCSQQKDEKLQKIVKALCQCYQDKCKNEKKIGEILAECDKHLIEKDNKSLKYLCECFKDDKNKLSNKSEEFQTPIRPKCNQTSSHFDQQKNEKLQRILEALCKLKVDDENLIDLHDSEQNCLLRKTENFNKNLEMEIETMFDTALSQGDQQRDEKELKLVKNLCQCYQNIKQRDEDEETIDKVLGLCCQEKCVDMTKHVVGEKHLEDKCCSHSQESDIDDLRIPNQNTLDKKQKNKNKRTTNNKISCECYKKKHKIEKNQNLHQCSFDPKPDFAESEYIENSYKSILQDTENKGKYSKIPIQSTFYQVLGQFNQYVCPKESLNIPEALYECFKQISEEESKNEKVLKHCDKQICEKGRKFLETLCKHRKDVKKLKSFEELCRCFVQKKKNGRIHPKTQIKIMLVKVLYECSQNICAEEKEILQSLCEYYQLMCEKENKIKTFLCNCDKHVNQQTKKRKSFCFCEPRKSVVLDNRLKNLCQSCLKLDTSKRKCLNKKVQAMFDKTLCQCDQQICGNEKEILKVFYQCFQQMCEKEEKLHKTLCECQCNDQFVRKNEKKFFKNLCQCERQIREQKKTLLKALCHCEQEIFIKEKKILKCEVEKENPFIFELVESVVEKTDHQGSNLETQIKSMCKKASNHYDKDFQGVEKHILRILCQCYKQICARQKTIDMVYLQCLKQAREREKEMLKILRKNKKKEKNKTNERCICLFAPNKSFCEFYLQNSVNDDFKMQIQVMFVKGLFQCDQQICENGKDILKALCQYYQKICDTVKKIDKILSLCNKDPCEKEMKIFEALCKEKNADKKLPCPTKSEPKNTTPKCKYYLKDLCKSYVAQTANECKCIGKEIQTMFNKALCQCDELMCEKERQILEGLEKSFKQICGQEQKFYEGLCQSRQETCGKEKKILGILRQCDQHIYNKKKNILEALCRCYQQICKKETEILKALNKLKTKDESCKQLDKTDNQGKIFELQIATMCQTLCQDHDYNICGKDKNILNTLCQSYQEICKKEGKINDVLCLYDMQVGGKETNILDAKGKKSKKKGSIHVCEPKKALMKHNIEDLCTFYLEQTDNVTTNSETQSQAMLAKTLCLYDQKICGKEKEMFKALCQFFYQICKKEGKIDKILHECDQRVCGKDKKSMRIKELEYLCKCYLKQSTDLRKCIEKHIQEMFNKLLAQCNQETCAKGKLFLESLRHCYQQICRKEEKLHRALCQSDDKQLLGKEKKIVNTLCQSDQEIYAVEKKILEYLCEFEEHINEKQKKMHQVLCECYPKNNKTGKDVDIQEGLCHKNQDKVLTPPDKYNLQKTTFKHCVIVSDQSNSEEEKNLKYPWTFSQQKKEISDEPRSEQPSSEEEKNLKRPFKFCQQNELMSDQSRSEQPGSEKTSSEKTCSEKTSSEEEKQLKYPRKSSQTNKVVLDLPSCEEEKKLKNLRKLGSLKSKKVNTEKHCNNSRQRPNHPLEIKINSEDMSIMNEEEFEHNMKSFGSQGISPPEKPCTTGKCKTSYRNILRKCKCLGRLNESLKIQCDNVTCKSSRSLKEVKNFVNSAHRRRSENFHKRKGLSIGKSSCVCDCSSSSTSKKAVLECVSYPCYKYKQQQPRKSFGANNAICVCCCSTSKRIHDRVSQKSREKKLKKPKKSKHKRRNFLPWKKKSDKTWKGRCKKSKLFKACMKKSKEKKKQFKKLVSVELPGALKSVSERILSKKTDPNHCAYILSLRRTPFKRLYYLFPNLYPMWISFVRCSREISDLALCGLAIVFWSPCIILFELLRGLMCCTMCTR